MNDINEKYLNRILDSAREGLANANAAIKQMDEQYVQINAQREEMEDAIKEISELLGLEGDEEGGSDE